MRAGSRAGTSSEQSKCNLSILTAFRGEFEYDLFLKNDYGTSGFTQWYYFKVANTRKDVTYRFNLVNMMKPDSTYAMGMKPLIYSAKEAEKNNIGWQRDGYNIAYYQNSRKSKFLVIQTCRKLWLLKHIFFSVNECFFNS